MLIKRDALCTCLKGILLNGQVGWGKSTGEHGARAHDVSKLCDEYLHWFLQLSRYLGWSEVVVVEGRNGMHQFLFLGEVS